MQRRLRTAGSPGCRPQERLPRQMSHNNLFEMRGLAGGGRQAEKERKKYVSFTVELDRSGGPIGITLATEATEDSSECSEDRPPPILISSMTEGGLAHRTKAIHLRDELVEVNGINVKGRSLGEAIPLLQNAGSLVKLKLTRVVTIPERECRVPSFRLPPASPRASPIYAPVQPAASPLYSPVRNNNNLQQSPAPSPAPPHSGLRSPSFSSSKRSNSSSRTEEEDQLTTITLIPQHGPKGLEGPVPQEVNKVSLFKDPIYEDFGFSVSDGLYERGIYINRIRKGGPADESGLLKPFDRILQINQTRTTEFDCCLAVPLIAAAGEKIDLLVTRAFPEENEMDSNNNKDDKDSVDTGSVPWIDDTDKESSMSS